MTRDEWPRSLPAQTAIYVGHTDRGAEAIKSIYALLKATKRLRQKQ